MIARIDERGECGVPLIDDDGVCTFVGEVDLYLDLHTGEGEWQCPACGALHENDLEVVMVPSHSIPQELIAHEAEILRRVHGALAEQAQGVPGLLSDADPNIERSARAVVHAAEPLIAAYTLRAFAAGTEEMMTHLPREAQAGVALAVLSARATADRIEGGWA